MQSLACRCVDGEAGLNIFGPSTLTFMYGAGWTEKKDGRVNPKMRMQGWMCLSSMTVVLSTLTGIRVWGTVLAAQSLCYPSSLRSMQPWNVFVGQSHGPSDCQPYGSDALAVCSTCVPSPLENKRKLQRSYNFTVSGSSIASSLPSFRSLNSKAVIFNQSYTLLVDGSIALQF